MKKLFALFTALLLFVTLVPVHSFAAPSLRVVVDGNKINFPDALPFLDAKNRVQVPVRFVSEALGAKVGWVPASKTVTIELNGKKLALVIGKKQYTVDNVKKTMDTAALMKTERTFVPLRFVSEGLGVGVKWDQAVSTAYITTGNDGSNSKPVASPAPSAGTKHTANGFTYYENTGSMLRVDPTQENPPKENAVLIIMVDVMRKSANYEKQMQETEAILRQQIEPQTVDEILAYTAPKMTREYDLPMKFFTDSKYEVIVSGKAYNQLVFTIFRR
ncbi:copper amine oxidase N-terminal domain-containing protein [Paenibacillus albidus]|uniref:copper amine oxidase N-terminal domain-containing protein n=1 Tax=Paenibacillus albidus TaxID=2041023 RepID=UPI001BEC8CC8|nr:copper amine oxidase N-terminal domain-containing protein [Paenibacillus albidus]MBT2293174.1 copper amine oxidase N-terminal domain-containing protein [Paenibacillus albidus]